MIDPDHCTIRFTEADVPEGFDGIPTPDELTARREAEERQRRKDENLRWLEEHCDFEPFGDVW